MAKAPAIVLATAITPLDNHLKALAEDINKNYNQAIGGVISRLPVRFTMPSLTSMINSHTGKNGKRI